MSRKELKPAETWLNVRSRLRLQPPGFVAMSGLETAVLLAIEFVCGAAAGLALARWTGRRTTDVLIGGVGGLILTWLAAYIPGVARYVGHVERVADATAQSVGGVTPAILVGVGVAGLLGGTISMALAGMFGARNAP